MEGISLPALREDMATRGGGKYDRVSVRWNGHICDFAQAGTFTALEARDQRIQKGRHWHNHETPNY